MDYPKIKSRLATAKYIGLSDLAALSLYKTKDVEAAKDMSITDIYEYFTLTDAFYDMQISTIPAVIKVVSALKLFEPRIVITDSVKGPARLAKLTSILDSLVAEVSLNFTATDKVAVLALGKELVSDAHIDGCANCTLGDIEYARAI